MAGGGARPGAGRKPGIPNKRTQALVKRAEEAVEKAATEGKLPLQIMLENARYYYDVAKDAEEALSKMTVADVGAEGLPPAEQFKLLLAEVRKAAGFRQMAQEAARDAAPYMHARLNSVEAKITHRDGMTLDELRRAIARDLAAAGVQSASFADFDGAGEAVPTGRPH